MVVIIHIVRDVEHVILFLQYLSRTLAQIMLILISYVRNFQVLFRGIFRRRIASDLFKIVIVVHCYGLIDRVACISKILIWRRVNIFINFAVGDGSIFLFKVNL